MFVLNECTLAKYVCAGQLATYVGNNTEVDNESNWKVCISHVLFQAHFNSLILSPFRLIQNTMTNN